MIIFMENKFAKSVNNEICSDCEASKSGRCFQHGGEEKVTWEKVVQEVSKWQQLQIILDGLITYLILIMLSMGEPE